MNNFLFLDLKMETNKSELLNEGITIALDEADFALLRILQKDATLPLERLANKVGLSKTAVWNRIQRYHATGVINRQVVVVDPKKVGISETFFVAVRTNNHNAKWFAEFIKIISKFPEITEAHRMAGHIDYFLKVQVRSTREFDLFYKRLVKEIDLFDVNSSLSMEVLKNETALPL